MPFRLTLECPIDGLQLVNNAPMTVRGGGSVNEATEHVHINFPNPTMTCGNGHQWQFSPDDTMQLNRVGI